MIPEETDHRRTILKSLKRNDVGQRHATGYLYDPVFLAHTLRHHPENHTRLEAVMALLRESGELDRLISLPFAPATPSQLCAAHVDAYVDLVKQLSARGGAMLGPDTYINAASFQAASSAAGAAIAAARAVLAGDVDRAFALVRPPGHHAFADHGEGFCLFNNIALAAGYALGDAPAEDSRPRPPSLERVMIVDWDVHHGNGTQSIFYEDPRVLFVSIHQLPLYPLSGRVDEIGAGAGRGSTVNVPFPPGVGDEGYARALDEIVVPLARRYRPQLLLMSAGFDAHWVDELAGMRVSLRGFARIVDVLCRLSEELCEGRLVAVLEGGYDHDVLSYGVLNTLRALRGESPDTALDPLGPFTGRPASADPIIHRVKTVHGLP